MLVINRNNDQQLPSDLLRFLAVISCFGTDRIPLENRQLMKPQDQRARSQLHDIRIVNLPETFRSAHFQPTRNRASDDLRQGKLVAEAIQDMNYVFGNRHNSPPINK